MLEPERSICEVMAVGSICRSGEGVILDVSIKLTLESEISLFPIRAGSSPEGKLLFVGLADSAMSQLPLMRPVGPATS